MSSPDLRYKSKGDLTNGPVRGHLIRLSIPMIWAMLAVIFVQITDMFFISMLGTRELTGMSFTFPVTMLVSNLIFGFNIATSSVVSRMIGQNKMEEAKRVALHGLALAFSVSVSVSLLFYVLMNAIFRMLGADAASMGVIHDYMPVWLISSAFLALTVNSNSAVRATGDTFLPSLVMVGLATINLILAPVFIFGLLGFPALKVFGAACATLTAILCSVVMALYLLVVHKNFIPHDGPHFDKVKDSLKRLGVIAIPAGMGNVIMPLATGVITAILAREGPEVVAAFGVVSRVEAMAMIVVIALAIGMAPLIGQNWGAEKYTRVHETIGLAISYNFAWSLFVAIIFGLFAKSIGGVFTADPVIIHYVAVYFWIVPVTYGFGNLVFGWSSAFNAMGAPQRSFFMIATRAFVMTVPAAILGGWLYGPSGVFLGLALVNVVSGCVFQVISWRACLRDEGVKTPVLI